MPRTLYTVHHWDGRSSPGWGLGSASADSVCYFHSLSSSAGGNKCCWSGFSLVLSCTDDGCFRGNFGGHLYPLGSLPYLGTVSALVLAGVVPCVLS